jgi:hypothetical protein
MSLAGYFFASETIFMNITKTLIAVLITSVLLVGSAYAEAAALKGIKLGFGFDRGFGVTGSLGDLNGFLGNDGVAVDYLFHKDKLNVNADVPVFWYVGAGGYGDWDGDLGVRLPVGIEARFAERVDGYAQLIPRFRFNNTADFGLDFGVGVRYLF